MDKKEKEILQLVAHTIRVVSAETVENAKSGHPGAPMGLAEISAVLWGKILKVNPDEPRWENRDRFILSAGHASAMLYTILHLTGFDIKIEDLKNFRKWGSITPGHPELSPEHGIEATTGPLGQGFAMGVGMAIAQRKLMNIFNRPGYNIIDHFIFAVVSDGDIMEGISQEAASLAGHLGLGRIIYIYDSNKITIDGSTSLTLSEDVRKKLESMGWHTSEIDGEDFEAIEQAIEEAKKVEDKPSLILAHTKIGRFSPTKEGSPKSHGAPLGPEELEGLKRNIGWKYRPFEIPKEVHDFFDERRKVLKNEYRNWVRKFEEYKSKFKDLAEMWNKFFSSPYYMPDDLEKYLPKYEKGKEVATRNASEDTIQILAEKIPNLIGGSADLAESVKTTILKSKPISRDDFSGRNIYFGVREHAMGGILNGIALYGGLIPFGGTFLVFSDYMRPSIRLAALMKTKVIYVFSHDSIFVGEDGPTHQPVEHLASLRAIPNLVVIRPADANEVPYAWEMALIEKRPVALILTRQGIPVIDRKKYAPPHLIRKGGYVIADNDNPEVSIFATGSEVSLALEVHELLEENGIKSRVINLASWEIFEEQDEEYKNKVLGWKEDTIRVVIEAASPFGWAKYVGEDGIYICVETFGASAPYKVIKEKFGFTKEKIAEKIIERLRIKNNKNVQKNK